MIRLGPVDGLASSLKGWRDVVSPFIFSGPFPVLLEWHSARGYSAPKVQCR